jgi:thioester reductase-like protein
MKTMKDRFDLENGITSLFSTADDLRTVADMMYDSNLIYNADRTHTVLHGIAEVLDAKIEKLSDTFEQVYQLNEYAPDDIKREREAVLQRLRDAQLKELKGVLDDSEDEDKEGM